MNIITLDRGTINESKHYTLTEEEKHALSVVKEIFRKFAYDDFRLSCPLGYPHEISYAMSKIRDHEGDYFYPNKLNQYNII